MNGVVLVSPYLNPTIEDDGDLSPVPWMMTLPSITAAHLERENKLTPDAMTGVIAYTQGEYATTLLKGRTDEEATKKMIQRVTDLTGLDPAFVKYSGGRLETRAYLREVFREQGKLGSVYDSNVTCSIRFPIHRETAGQRSAAGQHDCAYDHGDGGLCNAHGGLEGGCAL